MRKVTNRDRVEGWIENTWFKMLARVGMVLASVIGLPLFYFVMSQAWASYSTLQSTQRQMTNTLALVQQAFEGRVRETDRRLDRMDQQINTLAEEQRRFFYGRGRQ